MIDLSFKDYYTKNELVDIAKNKLEIIEAQNINLQSKVNDIRTKYGSKYPEYSDKIDQMLNKSIKLTDKSKINLEELVKEMDNKLSQLNQDKDKIVKNVEQQLDQVKDIEQNIKSSTIDAKNQIESETENVLFEIKQLEEMLDSEIPIEILKLDDNTALSELETILKTSQEKINLLEKKAIIKKKNPKKFQEKLDFVTKFESNSGGTIDTDVKDLEVKYIEFTNNSSGNYISQDNILNLDSKKAIFNGIKLGKKSTNFNYDDPFNNSGKLHDHDIIEGEILFDDNGPSKYTGQLIVLSNEELSKKTDLIDNKNSNIYVTGFGNTKIVYNKKSRNYNAIYEGDVVAGNLHGSGELKFNNRKYIGRFQFGEMHGEGIIYDLNDNVIVEGQWENDKRI